MDASQFKQALAETHVRLADHLKDIERLQQLDTDAGVHCLKFLNRAIDDWMPSFEYVQQRAFKAKTKTASE